MTKILDAKHGRDKLAEAISDLMREATSGLRCEMENEAYELGGLNGPTYRKWVEVDNELDDAIERYATKCAALAPAPKQPDPRGDEARERRMTMQEDDQ